MDLTKAITLATNAHAGQFRKINGEPYIFHPMRVMLKASQFGEKYGIIAILHDTLEDTKLTVQDLISEGFSDEIILAVETLTKLKGAPYNEYLTKVRNNPVALVVKILDIEDNLSDMETVGVFDKDMELNLRTKYANALRFLRGR